MEVLYKLRAMDDIHDLIPEMIYLPMKDFGNKILCVIV
jgi:hypothetical protein